MPLPLVAIVGRPNVGKSSLFNWLAGRRIAIVDPTAGVTRDRITALVQTGDCWFELVDTGGMGIEDKDQLTEDVERQIQLAMDQAAVILFIVDARAGIMPLDERVAKRLRGIGKPVLCVVNKCDAPRFEPQVAEFHRLGFQPVVPVSAQQKIGQDVLLNAIAGNLPEVDEDPPPDVTCKLAIVGRRNTGKSTFINAIAREDRVIVSEVPGTTRDSIDIRFERNRQVFIAIDTAGVRKRRSVKGNIEFYSLARAERSIRRADVVLLFIDARLKISQVDKKLAGYVLEQHKPAIFVINKWDLVRPLTTGEYGEYLHKVFPSLDYVPIAFATAKTGRNVQQILDLAQKLQNQAELRVGTGELNRVVRMAVEHQNLPLRQNRRPKIYYATQVAASPPTIVLFTNGPQLIDNTYQRYMIKVFRDHLPFNDVPIKLLLRKRGDSDTHPEADQDAAAPEPRKPKRTRGRKPKEPELWSD